MERERAVLLAALRSWIRNPSYGGELERLVGALRLLHRRTTDPEGEAAQGAWYDEARRHFHQNEAALRSQARFTERILDRIQSGAAPRAESNQPSQAEVHLRAPPRGVGSGRFVLASELPRAATVTFAAGTLRGLTLPWSDRVPVRFDPSEPTLHAGRSVVVRITVDLTTCPARPRDRLELGVDVIGDGETMMKLWIDLSIDPEEAG